MAQEALEDAVRRKANDEWIEAARTRRPRTTSRIDTAALLDEVREEFGS